MGVIRSGVTELRLCEGYVPQYKQMVEIAHPFLKIIVDEYGLKETIKRFSDPFWFQSFATALGFEHNYTGATTVTIKAIKESLEKGNEDLGLVVVGGKGKEAISVASWFEAKDMPELANVSKEIAKADNNLMQDSYDLYFHSFIIDVDHFNYAIINQGMNTKDQLVRRYHWFNAEGYDDNSTSTRIKEKGLNIRNENKEIKKGMMDIIKDYSPQQITKKILLLRKGYEMFKKGQLNLLDREEINLFKTIRYIPYYLYFPKRLEEKALEVAKNASNYKELFLSQGMGKSTLRGLAYLSALIYGEEIQWEDPQKYCYAFGTKAGKPWYVERKAMSDAAKILKELAESAEITAKQKKEVLKRLAKIV